MKYIKTIKKISIIVVLIFAVSVLFSNNSQALGDIFSGADGFLKNGDSVSSIIDEGQLIETSNFMYKLLLAIGIVVMFIVGTILGIQFMVASAEDKAEVKKALIPYVIGCAVIFGAFTIWSIAVNIGQDVTGASGGSSSSSGTGAGGAGGASDTTVVMPY